MPVTQAFDFRAVLQQRKRRHLCTGHVLSYYSGSLSLYWPSAVPYPLFCPGPPWRVSTMKAEIVPLSLC